MCVGPPLPPGPMMTINLPFELEIQWGIPYSHGNFPVESYNIEIVSTTSSNIQSMLAEVREYNDTSYNYTFDSKATLLECHNITASITAVSASGESEPGTVSRNYPIGKQQLICVYNQELVCSAYVLLNHMEPWSCCEVMF